MSTDPNPIRFDDLGIGALWQSYQGNVEELATLVESDHPLNPQVRKEIAAILRGEHEKLKAPALKRGKGAPISRGSDDANLDREVVAFIKRRTAEEAGKPADKRLRKKSIIGEAAQKFERSDSYIEKTLRRVQRQVDRLRWLMQAHDSRT